MNLAAPLSRAYCRSRPFVRFAVTSANVSMPNTDCLLLTLGEINLSDIALLPRDDRKKAKGSNDKVEMQIGKLMNGLLDLIASVVNCKVCVLSIQRISSGCVSKT